MGVVEEGWGGWAPTPGGAPLYIQKDDHWTHFDNSVNAVSFGFVATAILISMFLVMAIFEKFLRTTSPLDSRRRLSDLESQNHIVAFNSKLRYPSSPKNKMAADKCKCKRSIGGDAGQQDPDLHRTSCSGALPTGASAVAATSAIMMGNKCKCKRSIGGDAGQQDPDLHRTSCSGALPTGASAMAATSTALILMGE
ncbi:hypothetical protein SASPL_124009 [Salvia splendens]|uniref:Uncharacterized protein n=1 Tax=Salvia splendens TaxID=180675 RepID=A0A8X8ZTZ4_SALSN|nr:hypothetical protein SASPL_124009 [Salvia splendens]